MPSSLSRKFLIGVLRLLRAACYLKVRNQNFEIERMHLKRDIVLGLLEIVSGAGNLRCRI